MPRVREILASAIILLGIAGGVYAAELTSGSFMIEDPVISSGGTYATSSSFQLFGSLDGLFTGTGSSGSFEGRYGFLYFPTVTTPSVSVSQSGTTTAFVSWTAAVGSLGWIVGDYRLGRATDEDGPYSYSNEGTALSATSTGLSEGTTYYFVVVVEDSFGTAIGTSSPVSLTMPGGSGDDEDDEDDDDDGGGGGLSNTRGTGSGTQVTLTGYAFPRANVVVLRDGSAVAASRANDSGRFEIPLTVVTQGSYLFTLYAEDDQGFRSSLTVPVTLGVFPITVGSLFLPPTIGVSLIEGTGIIEGITVPGAKVIAIVTDETGAIIDVREAIASGGGLYEMERGISIDNDFNIKVYAQAHALTSGQSLLVALRDLVEQGATRRAADLNADGKINLVDFSILIYWYGRNNPPAHVDLTHDGLVDLRDFSVLSFYWTG